MDNPPSRNPDSDEDFNPVVRVQADPARPLSPYDAFLVPDAERENVPQVEALLADPEIAGYIRGNTDTGWNRTRVMHTLAGFAATALCLAALVLFLPGNMLSGHKPPVPQDTPKPQPYPDAAMLPILYRDTIRDINADIAAGNRWQAAHDKLRRFIADAEGDKTDPPRELRTWALREMLVILASKEIPPAAYTDEYADSVHAGLQADAGAQAPPFRAEAAYVRLLAARPAAKDAGEAQANRDRLIAVLEKVRGEYPDLLDKNRELLTIEAEQHILRFPAEYGEDNRSLDYHWRRAAHAIVRLYDLYGKRDPAVRQLDRRRWQAVDRYFNFTLFTLDTKRLGRLKEINLDGFTYTRGQVRAELENL